MATASLSGSSDHHQIFNNPNVAVGGNSGTQINRRPAENQWEEKEYCSICFEEVNVNQMHENMFCHHRHCFSCMAVYVKVNLIDDGGVPHCPRPGCISGLTKDDCEKLLPSKLLDILIKRLKEAEIPDSVKVYCPYSNCSALMDLSGLDRCPQPPSPSSSQLFPTTTATKCQRCHRLFCIECRVPWHQDMSCQDYASQLCGPDVELNFLAENKKWKQCPNCKQMIERSQGCIHMICRCGFEFCYECGVTWKYRKLLCNCEYKYDDEEDHHEDDDEYNYGDEC